MRNGATLLSASRLTCADAGMKALLLAALHLAVIAARLCGRGGVRAVMAENLLLRQQLVTIAPFAALLLNCGIAASQDVRDQRKVISTFRTQGLSFLQSFNPAIRCVYFRLSVAFVMCGTSGSVDAV